MPESVNVVNKRELAKQSYAVAFESLIDHIASGNNLEDFCNEYHQKITPGRYRQWIRSDPQRQKQFKEAQELGADAIFDSVTRIADGVDANGDPIMEEVGRSKLRVDVRFKAMAIQSPERYGNDNKQSSTTVVQISLVQSMQPRKLLALQIVNDPDDDDIFDTPPLELTTTLDSNDNLDDEDE